MASNDKEQTEKVFCLFHQKISCQCISPVTKDKDLIYRLEDNIKLNIILNKYETDEEIITLRVEEIAAFQNRLGQLQNL